MRLHLKSLDPSTTLGNMDNKLIPNQEPEPLPNELYDQLADMDMGLTGQDDFDPTSWMLFDLENDCD